MNSVRFASPRPASKLRLLFILWLAVQPLLAASSTNRIRNEALSPSPSGAANATSKAVVDKNYGKLPLSFEMNRGQARPEVRFLARGGNAALFLMPNEAALALQKATSDPSDPGKATSNPQSATLRLKLAGANKQPRVIGLDELPGKSSYFAGSDPRQWTTDVPTYARVKYEQVYPGIDLIFYGNQQQLEYDFVVAPGGDPKQIKLSFEGARKMRVETNGDLVLETKAGEVRQHKPVVYQEVNGERREIAGRYVGLQRNQVGFEVSEYDLSRPLVIDPVFAYATFYGSSPGVAIAVDKDGNAYVAAGIPGTAGAYQGGSALSVSKLNATGTAVIYAATFGGSQDDRIFDVAVDLSGNCYIVGRTESPSFPTTPGAFQTNFGRVADNNYNGFVLKLNAGGNALVYSTFLKGDMPSPLTEPKVTEVTAIAVDANGNAFVTGSTNTTDFPSTPGAFQTAIATYPRSSGGSFPPTDPFITKLNPTGTALVYSTFLGSASNTEEGKDIAVDKEGNVYVTCSTNNGHVDVRRPQGTPFPVTPGAYRTTDTFGSEGTFLVRYASISKLNATGTALIYSTLIGSSPISSEPVRVAIDSAGSAYVTGYTTSTTFPTTPGAYQTVGGGKSTAFPGDDNPDFFITKLNASGSALVYSTYLGGNYVDRCFGLAVDGGGNAHVTGLTLSSDFPQIGLPPQTIGVVENSGGFVTKLNATGSAIIQSIFIKLSRINAIALDDAGNAYVAGQGGLIQPTLNAYQSAPSTGFVAKVTSPRSVLSVSAAGYTPDLASESIVAAFGSGLATTTQVATSTPLPTTLAGTTVKVKDGAGVEREAPLFFVSPTQINYLLPAGTTSGLATVDVNNGDGSRSTAQVRIDRVAPGLFTANASGQGVAAAVALRVKADGSQTFEPVARFDPAQSQFVAAPVDLGPESDQVFLILYGTGVRFRSGLAAVSAKVGGMDAQVTYAGAQGSLVGLDQVNLRLPRSLTGRGGVDVVLNVDGKAANLVQVSIK